MSVRFDEVAEQHVRTLDRMIERGGVGQLRKLYQEAQADLERKITRALGRGSAPFTMQQYRTLLAQVRAGQMQIALRMGSESARSVIETQTESLRQLVTQVKRLERMHDAPPRTLPIEEASRFAGVIDKNKSSLLAQSEASMRSYGSRLVKRMEGKLALSLATGDTLGEAVERLGETADVEWWRAERVVRTEQAWASHSAVVEGMRASSAALGEMYLQWSELVAGRSPLDDRVGADSVAMHGQVALPGDMYTMPASAASIVIHNRWGRSRVSPHMIGQQWPHPPNRPHDRATLLPWRASWGVPGWRVVAGLKVPVRSAAT